jgi:hypothetical protein
MEVECFSLEFAEVFGGISFVDTFFTLFALASFEETFLESILDLDVGLEVDDDFLEADLTFKDIRTRGKKNCCHA